MSDSTHITKMSPVARHSAPVFSSIDELISDQRDVAVIRDEDQDKPGHFYISAYKTFNTANATNKDISYSYLTACHLLSINVPKSSTDSNSSHTLFTSPQTLLYPEVCPVLTDLPEKFHINCNIISDPLADMPALSPTPPPFQPTG